ncbi:MAG: hypothetical protein OEY49_06495, partial [Candidatus Heimdallarchaeota archaeon]|nr:hypothetical protein [Candidatus Heimdallarchaeota archaeon]
MSIAVYLETYNGNLIKASKEAITAANQLAGIMGKEVYGIVIDNQVDNAVSDAGKFGVTKVMISSGISLYHPTLYARIIANASKDADVVIFPATVWGKEISPQVCLKLNATPISEISGIEDGPTFKRSIHGNKIIATVSGTGKLVITVRSGIFDLPETGDATATVENISSEITT